MSRRATRSRWAVLALAASALLLASCGDDDGDGGATETSGGAHSFAINSLDGETIATADDVTAAEAAADPVTGEPSVSVELSPAAVRRLRRATRPPSSGFEVVFDNRTISRPVIDPQANPDGIDASRGVLISGGLTIEQTEEIADFLASSSTQ